MSFFNAFFYKIIDIFQLFGNNWEKNSRSDFQSELIFLIGDNNRKKNGDNNRKKIKQTENNLRWLDDDSNRNKLNWIADRVMYFVFQMILFSLKVFKVNMLLHHVVSSNAFMHIKSRQIKQLIAFIANWYWLCLTDSSSSLQHRLAYLTGYIGTRFSHRF